MDASNGNAEWATALPSTVPRVPLGCVLRRTIVAVQSGSAVYQVEARDLPDDCRARAAVQGLTVPPAKLAVKTLRASALEGPQGGVARALLASEAAVLAHIAALRPKASSTDDAAPHAHWSERVPSLAAVGVAGDTLRCPATAHCATTTPCFPDGHAAAASPAGAALWMSYFRAAPSHAIGFEFPNGLSAKPDKSSGRVDPFLRGVVAQLATILAGLHAEARVAHLDVKLPNILLNPDGVVHVVDFGSASALGAVLPAGKLTGTSHTRAPELLLSMRNPAAAAGVAVPAPVANAACDVFGLGVALFELATGTPCFGALDATWTPSFDPEKRVPLSIPGDDRGHCRDLIVRLLQANPAERLGCRPCADSATAPPDWPSVMAHRFFADVSASAKASDLAEWAAVAYDASGPYEEELDMQLLGM